VTGASSSFPVVTLVSDLKQVTRGDMLARLERASALGAAKCGRLAVQLRDPQLDGRELWDWGLALSNMAKRAGAQFWVNDRMDVALAFQADGVHLGRQSVSVKEARALLGTAFKITASAHSIADVLEAARAGADGVFLSPILDSPGKGTPLGLSALTEAKRALAEAGARTSLVALGGVDSGRAPACLGAGAEGVAVVRADLGSTLVTLLAT